MKKDAQPRQQPPEDAGHSNAGGRTNRPRTAAPPANAPDDRPAPTAEQREEAERALKTGGQESQ